MSHVSAGQAQGLGYGISARPSNAFQAVADVAGLSFQVANTALASLLDEPLPALPPGAKPYQRGISIEQALTYRNPQAALGILDVPFVEMKYQLAEPQLHSNVEFYLASASSQTDPVLKVHYLMAAFDDLELMIAGIFEDNGGRALSVGQVGMISRWRQMQSHVAGRITQALSFAGLSVSDVSVLLQKDPTAKVNPQAYQLDCLMGRATQGQPLNAITGGSFANPQRRSLGLETASQKIVSASQRMFSQVEAHLDYAAHAGTYDTVSRNVQSAYEILRNVEALVKLAEVLAESGDSGLMSQVEALRSQADTLWYRDPGADQNEGPVTALGGTDGFVLLSQADSRGYVNRATMV
ncbi:MAG: hypothetical protein SFZ03_08140 [Candidatus Melainabacteria bacterium]|nr:hypothetical protein [Candidatus Melainabacteria bacterium]